MIEFFIRLINNIQDPMKLTSVSDKIEGYVSIFGTYLATIVTTNYIFGMSYSLTLGTFHNIPLSISEYFYLSFIINHTLPMADEAILDTIKVINKDIFLNYLQMAHITISKLIDLTIIAIVVKYINNLINRNHR
ncbi:hypothetical protein [Cytobacillus sp. BC1816]|uniref:hypothetical protein n=1 Tax=Cytobacillus sp. BC1816 TaxID=3440154 RepID=UPI003F50F6A8